MAKTQHINDSTTREILTEAGALGLVSYDPIVRRVIMVSVNSSPLPISSKAIEDSLNSYYKSAIASWKVDILPGTVEVTSITAEGFKTQGSGLFARYTSHMKKVIEAFEEQHGKLNKDDLCLFFIDVANSPLDGFMPLDGKYGFIFNYNNNPATLAHELAHGAFNLRHTFSSKAQYQLNQRTTKNLLDYTNSTELWKYQWDLIHNPETILLGFMQNEEEGAAIRNDNIKIQQVMRLIRYSIATGAEVEIDLGRANLIANTSFDFEIGIFKFKTFAISTTKPITGPIKLRFAKDGFNETSNNSFFKLANAYFTITVNIADEQLLKKYLLTEKAVVSLFVNGYDPLLPEQKDIIYTTSGYWEGMDDRFNERLGPDYVFYADGNKSISTSNHIDVANFLASMETSYAARYSSRELINERIDLVNKCYYLYKARQDFKSALPLWPIGLWKAYEGYGEKNLIEKLNECFQKPACVKLNSQPNKNGFDERERKGRNAGNAFVQTLKALRLIDGDEINIVCHSMGFAYAQGIIAVLKDAILKKELPNLVFNGYYIIAPENPNSGSVNTSEWKQIWQYGSHEGQLADRPWLQDGVARQAPIVNIGANRAYIPIDDKTVPQGFLESHLIENYTWIFRLEGGIGYVTPRK